LNQTHNQGEGKTANCSRPEVSDIISDFKKVMLIYSFSEKNLNKQLTTCIASWAPCFYMFQCICNNSSAGL